MQHPSSSFYNTQELQSVLSSSRKGSFAKSPVRTTSPMKTSSKLSSFLSPVLQPQPSSQLQAAQKSQEDQVKNQAAESPTRSRPKTAREPPSNASASKRQAFSRRTDSM